MGYRLKVEGPSTTELNENSVTHITFDAGTSNAAFNARATFTELGMKVYGKINFSISGENADPTVDLAIWSVQGSDTKDCYRKVTVLAVEGGQTVRSYVFPNAFVRQYTEEISDETGVGTFYIEIRQKMDLNSAVEFTGGFE